MDVKKENLFWKFTKWGWVTGLITLIVDLFYFIILLKIPFIKQFQYLFSFILFIPSIYFYYLMIVRISLYKDKKKIYLKLKQLMEKNEQYDPRIEKIFTTKCDKEIIKRLKKDFSKKTI
jgi:hypothetical protein